jgi:hypothetical protein
MTNNLDDFCFFILSHGRPDKIYTLETLKKINYSGKYFIIIDDEDATANQYYKNFGNRVLQFNKKEISKTFDTADNFDNRKTIVYARNACFDFAKKLNITYFMELDDDYTEFAFRFDKTGLFKWSKIKKIDNIISSLITFYKQSNADCIAFAQGGDFIGGSNSGITKNCLKRKAMNTLLCSTNKTFKFLGRINEDVNSYILHGSRGMIFFTIKEIAISQKQTQSNSGGMTDVYLNSGTYLKSFYSVIFNPSSVFVTKMITKNNRIHHKINWNYAVPKIIDEKYKKR